MCLRAALLPVDDLMSARKFTGKECDSESQLDHFRFRTVGSMMDRWMPPGPINLTAKRLINPAKTLNKYVYGGNNRVLSASLHEFC